jgi:hypothetical protein
MSTSGHYAVFDDAVSPDFPLGVELEVFVRRETPSVSSSRYAATIPSSRAIRGWRTTMRRAGLN